MLRVLAALGSWLTITVPLWGLLLALLIVKRFRPLLVVVISWTLPGLISSLWRTWAKPIPRGRNLVAAGFSAFQ